VTERQVRFTEQFFGRLDWLIVDGVSDDDLDEVE
jgi:hypothetical protein